MILLLDSRIFTAMIIEWHLDLSIQSLKARNMDLPCS